MELSSFSEEESREETTDEIRSVAAAAKDSLLPSKSKHLYDETYNAYRKWCCNKKIKSTCEDSILAYFNSDLSRYKSSSLWSKYSMLRSTINLREGIDISKFPSVIPFLKRKGEGYKPKKSLILTREHIDEFFIKADTKEHLFNKSPQYLQASRIVKLEDTKTKAERSFIITPGKFENVNTLELVRRYSALRPTRTTHNRFFVNYIKEKCTVQPVGIHKIGSVSSMVAKFLHLENFSSYTGHCFRRSSATLLANAGANMEVIKRHGGWRSSTVAEGYIEDCENTKINIAQKILGETAPVESSPYSSISTEYLEKSNSNVLKGNNEVGGMNICGNSNCVININHYYNN
ncbi:hypothetical protein NQ315_015331 [Exocentrus adspersus]|uniref:Tyr recombinase domain-containing protein n=1 Tax=Exocentrus adspersus TaxID=1586481 RepID=A0AAV8V644_9CUCU|nr:hypothetical protein NQ315_015331 [Exocentrus adspersus]